MNETIKSETGTYKISGTFTFNPGQTNLAGSFGTPSGNGMEILAEICMSRNPVEAFGEALIANKISTQVLVNIAAIGVKLLVESFGAAKSGTIGPFRKPDGAIVIDMSDPENANLTGEQIIARERSRIAREKGIPESQILFEEVGG